MIVEIYLFIFLDDWVAVYLFFCLLFIDDAYLVTEPPFHVRERPEDDLLESTTKDLGVERPRSCVSRLLERHETRLSLEKCRGDMRTFSVVETYLYVDEWERS